ncbi:unnamed protein product [Cuscuta epithymum]|uniref:Uncharacterized protein n=1 Tax=Cuscuta epithymum TaxID=186058 RepID=A0AAV0EH25_9ASTE|nr:unnamed protein product [Cuscuta epithymum]
MLRKKTLVELSNIISDYEKYSGELINKGKSFYLISKHAKNHNHLIVNNIFQIKKGSFPFTYLGANIFTSRTLNLYFEHILAKFDNKKLACWKHKLLSVGGRMILIKHVLSSLPLYHMVVPLSPGISFTKGKTVNYALLLCMESRLGPLTLKTPNYILKLLKNVQLSISSRPPTGFPVNYTHGSPCGRPRGHFSFFSLLSCSLSFLIPFFLPIFSS